MLNLVHNKLPTFPYRFRDLRFAKQQPPMIVVYALQNTTRNVALCTFDSREQSKPNNLRIFIVYIYFWNKNLSRAWRRTLKLRYTGLWKLCHINRHNFHNPVYPKLIMNYGVLINSRRPLDQKLSDPFTAFGSSTREIFRVIFDL